VGREQGWKEMSKYHWVRNISELWKTFYHSEFYTNLSNIDSYFEKLSNNCCYKN
jgi:hypothetical protein